MKALKLEGDRKPAPINFTVEGMAALRAAIGGLLVRYVH